MPKGKENDQFNGQDLEERIVRFEIEARLEIELNDHIHSNRDCGTFDDQDLETSDLPSTRKSDTYPDVRK